MTEYFVCLSITRREKHRREGVERHIPMVFIDVACQSEEDALAIFTQARQTLIESQAQKE